MNKVIVTTTIHEPSIALQKFAAMKDWQLVIAGDKKTPHTKYCNHDPNCVYLCDVTQEKFDPKLSELIGWNCIQRRNFAFLFACKELKADIVATIDDDNIPMDGWGENLSVGKTVVCDEYQIDQPAFDPLMVTVHSKLWHRGYPLELVRDRWRQRPTLRIRELKCDVQANLWNGEADVDAVCRFSYETSNCHFKNVDRPFCCDKPSPFNSQNTFLHKNVMPSYFMFPGVGRMDDVAASYHVQAQGFRVMYGGPTVVQKRNEHNIVTDLENEMWGIQNNLAIVKEIPINLHAVLDRIPERSLAAFRQYQSHFE